MKVRGAQTESSQAWETLTAAQCEGWRTLASTLPQRSNKTGLPIKKQGFNVFCSMYDRFRLANPTGAFPKDPPVDRFIPDPIAFSIEISDGAITFNANQASSSSQVVAILTQRLAGKNRLPQARAYRTAAYHQFLAGSLLFGVDVSAGYYALAYRLVSKVNGLAGPIKPLGTSLVGLSMVQGGVDDAANPTPAPPQREGIKAKKAA